MNNSIKALDMLSDCYVEMLTRDFEGIGDMNCAEELLLVYSDQMTEKQRATLAAFIVFWDALTVLESETLLHRSLNNRRI